MDFDEFLEKAEKIAKDISSVSSKSPYEIFRYVLHNRDTFTELRGYNKIMKIPR